jgi:hypothetical protein
MAQRPNYVRIPGSDALSTRARGDSVAAVVEAAAPASLARVEVPVGAGVVVVGPALVQGRSVPLLLDVMDRVGPLLSPESFVVYLQLYRLAVADGKNACRTSLAELSRRTRLQGRRLNKAVADLVAAGGVVLVDRTRDGTLYLLRWPDEIVARAPVVVTATVATVAKKARAPSVHPAKPPKPAAPAPAPAAPMVPAAPASATTTTATTTAPAPAAWPPRSVGEVCRWFAEQWGTPAGRNGADVASCAMDLLEDGWTFARIPALLEQFVKTAPKTTPLRDLGRVLQLSPPQR